MMSAGWRLWFWWLLASTASWSASGPVARYIGSSSDITVGGFVGVALGATVAGVLQWLVLRRMIIGSGRWILANIAAVAFSSLVVFTLGVINVDVGFAIGVGGLGTILGVLQWLVLREEVAWAGWWVLASTVGWIVGGFLSGVADATMFADLGWVIIGAVYGAITGAALVWLLKEQQPGKSAEA